MSSPPLLVALDVDSAESAVRMARLLGPHVGGFKVGLRLLHGPGPGIVGALARLGKPVFADAKLHDIPSQVEAAARRLGSHGARWVTVHASGGRAMVEAAVSGFGGGEGILAVTVMTSLDEATLHEAGFATSPGRLTSRLAALAAAAGAEGAVCAPQEIHTVKQAAPALRIVCPGIRPEGSARDDQARTSTPAEAFQRGADWLVVGRPIVNATDPVAAANAIVASIPADDK